MPYTTRLGPAAARSGKEETTMNMLATFDIRAAAPGDARILAKLIDIAGEGIPSWLWTRMAADEETPLDVGEARAQREAGGFSYRNAIVAERQGAVAAMMLGYPIGAPTDDEVAEIAGLPEPLRPFVELGHRAAGTFYVNALATLPGRRGAGLGTALLQAAEDIAATRGLSTMSIQLYEQNTGAVRLYERLGYRTAYALPVLSHPCQPYYDGDILLMLKDL